MASVIITNLLIHISLPQELHIWKPMISKRLPFEQFPSLDVVPHNPSEELCKLNRAFAL